MSYCKYTKQQERISYDNGKTWVYIENYRTGNLIECGLDFCFEKDPAPIYEWDDKGTTVCDGVNLYQELVYQVSYDNGHTWQDVEPRQTKKGNLIESNSLLCGYVPPVDYDSNILSGKWTDNSTSSQWYWNNTSNVKRSLEANTNKETKEFSYELTNKDLSYLFYENTAIEIIYSIPFNGRNITSLRLAFNKCTNLKQILNIEYWDVSSVYSMYAMFKGCTNFTTFDLSRWNTPKLNYIEECFYGCTKLQTLNLANWDVSSVEEIEKIFYGCTKLQILDLTGWTPFTNITSNTYITGMFHNCNSLNHIKCSQAFKDWCINKQETIELPTAMREGGSGTWEIIG